MINIQHCEGCRDDIYNTDTRTCFHLKSAKLVKKRRVGTSQCPPWNNCPIVQVPSCYKHGGYVFMDPDRVR